MPSLSTLDPRFREVAEWFFNLCHAADSRFVVTSARRSTLDQERLYSEYLAGKAGRYTVLPPGRSQHERGLAWDMMRIGVDPKSDELLAEAGRLWNSLGGHWAGASDPVHFEAAGILTGRARGFTGADATTGQAQARVPARRRRGRST